MFKNQFLITNESINEYISHLRNEELAQATIEKYTRDVKKCSKKVPREKGKDINCAKINPRQ